MKIIISVGQPGPEIESIRSRLESAGYVLITSSEVDEMLQLSLQQTVTPLLFSDFKFAIKFLAENNLDKINSRKFLIVKGKPVLNDQVKIIISKFKLKIYYPQIMEEFLTDINNVFNGSSSEDVDLDFSGS